MLRATRWLVLGLGLAAVSPLACGGEDPATDESNLESGREFTGHVPLQIPIDNSPSGDAEFNFCTSVPHGELDLNQAAWLNFFAANEYAHFGYVGPALNQL